MAVLGDAGCCASPVSGKGTGLAVVAAYVLAGEPAGHADHRDAFAAYAALRPDVAEAATRRTPPGVAAHPGRDPGARHRLRIAGSPTVDGPEHVSN